MQFSKLSAKKRGTGARTGEGSQTGQAAEVLNEKQELRQEPVVQM